MGVVTRSLGIPFGNLRGSHSPPEALLPSPHFWTRDRVPERPPRAASASLRQHDPRHYPGNRGSRTPGRHRPRMCAASSTRMCAPDLSLKGGGVASNRNPPSCLAPPHSSSFRRLSLQGNRQTDGLGKRGPETSGCRGLKGAEKREAPGSEKSLRRRRPWLRLPGPDRVADPFAGLGVGLRGARPSRWA